MINIQNLVTVLDAVYHCKDRTCDKCEAIFKTPDCPMNMHRDDVLTTLKTLESYLDEQWDLNDVLMKTTVSNEEFISLLQGE